MRTKLIAGLIMAAVLATVPGIAAAVDCTVSPERLYQDAVKRGWQFKCRYGVLHFNSQKLPGCSTKPTLSVQETVIFLHRSNPKDNSKTGKLFAGWRVKSFEVSGGQWTPRSRTTTARIYFSFDAPGGKFTRRYVSKVVVSKSGGSCSAFWSEAL